MKYALTTAFAFSFISVLSAFAADNRDNRDRENRVQERRDNGPVQRHQWARGERLPGEFWRGHEVTDWRARHFREPPRGYGWVEVNGDFVLAALATGVILDVAANPYAYPYPYPYPPGGYPYPDAGPYPPDYGNGPPPPLAQYPAPQGASVPTWYYCSDPPGYYPYVSACNQNWQPVPAAPPPAPPQN